ncbi:MAG: acyl carrier protein [Candidatus Omnitrophota bacterium]
MKEKVFSIISQIMDVPVSDIHESSSAKTIENWDSLQHMNLIFALEEAFDMKFLDEDIMGMACVQDILDILEKSSKVSADS